jgi:hypothetical protein
MEMTMQHAKLNQDIVERIHGEAKVTLDETFELLVKRRREIQNRNPAGKKITEAMLRHVLQDEELKKLHPKELRSPHEQILAIRNQENWKERSQLVDSASARALTARPPRVMDGPGFFVTEDTHLQVFGPPYVDQWTSQNQSGNAVVQGLSANKQTGDFGYFIGSADGAAWCGAGVWVQFVPTKTTLVQVRAYTPYNYQYDLNSQAGYTAHDSGGFGIFVLSWNFDGTGRFNDQNYKYSAWGDGTGWWDHHGNPSSPDPDFDNAYIFGNEAPYFPVRSDRVYLACIWGFGSSDAGGGYFGNAVSASDLNAAARFVVIGEQ